MAKLGTFNPPKKKAALSVTQGRLKDYRVVILTAPSRIVQCRVIRLLLDVGYICFFTISANLSSLLTI